MEDEWIKLLASATEVLPRDYHAVKQGRKTKTEVQRDLAVSQSRKYVNMACHFYFQKIQREIEETLRRKRGRYVPTLEFLVAIADMGKTLRNRLQQITDAYSAFLALTKTMHDGHTTELIDLPSNLGKFHLRYRRCRKKKRQWKTDCEETTASDATTLDNMWMQHINGISHRIYGCSVCETDATAPDQIGVVRQMANCPDEILYDDVDIADLQELCCYATGETEEEVVAMETGAAATGPTFPTHWGCESDEIGEGVQPTRGSYWSAPYVPAPIDTSSVTLDAVWDEEEPVQLQQDSQEETTKIHNETTKRVSGCQICSKTPRFPAEKYPEDWIHLRMATFPAAIHYGAPTFLNTEKGECTPYYCIGCIEQLACPMCLATGKALIDFCDHSCDLQYTGMALLEQDTYADVMWSVLVRRYPMQALPHVSGWERVFGYRTVRKQQDNKNCDRLGEKRKRE